MNSSDTIKPAYSNTYAGKSEMIAKEDTAKPTAIDIPSISLPKGGGAIRSIDEKFSVNAVNGTAGFTIPFPFSPSRNAFMPAMALSYNSGSGNGVFGLGWNAEPPSITRKTEMKLPEYDDANESDTFIFTGAEDLVPSYTKDQSDNWIKDTSPDGSRTRYKPRVEGAFGRIEKITEDNGLDMVLDYGEHALDPQPGDDNGWACRQDAFSAYRSGFEIRTYRLCRRLLMFHHFNELGDQPCLVRSMNFEYDSGAAFTFLKSVTETGHLSQGEGTYTGRSLPPLEFNYEPLSWNTEIRSLPKESMENLPVGIDEQFYQWIDLYGEGLPGVLTEQATGWYYKRNLGDGYFDAVKPVSPKPSLSGLALGAVHFQDIEANGQKSLVSNDLHGYYELTPENEWKPFKTFHELPNMDVRDPNLKFLDLDGDGKADMLISEENVFVWYASKGKLGFDDYRLAKKSRNEEKGPDIVFADGTQSIVLADMSGDGLMDIVRIRNSEIVYWPNLGYAKFGAKVNMSNAPLFDHPDHFNSHYVKLADLDGSGTTGIVYLAKDSFKIYFNQSGNSWSEENIIHGVNPLPFPKMDDQANITIVDLLGNGTGCIVWSSPLPKHAANPLRYIDLMKGKKPHIMTSYKNNMGRQVSMQYKPSTHFYLDDQKAGTPWISKLPFPVQVVSKVTVTDMCQQTNFSTLYRYHHGYYDYADREFRGFGRVDQVDTETFGAFAAGNINSPYITDDQTLFQPPVMSRTWYHTGAFIDREKILSRYAHEYFAPVSAAFREHSLSEPDLSTLDLAIDEYREALRSCKGMMLRQEVYELDVEELDKVKYKPVKLFTTACHNCYIQLLQPKLENLHAVFITTESEAITYSYELDLSDPGISPDPRIAAGLGR